MKNSIIIKHESGLKEHIICFCRNCVIIDPDSKIPIFYSYEHAIESGWIITKEIKYCPPDEKYVWICPECYKGINNE